MSTPDTPVAVVGGGIAGLSAAITLAAKGHSVLVLEAHSQLGGLCAFWERAGYTIDGCVHWMTGMYREGSMGGRFFDLWQSLGVPTEQAEMADFTVFSPADYPTHEEVFFGRDYKATRDTLKEQFPADCELLDEYFDMADVMHDIPLPAQGVGILRYLFQVGIKDVVRVLKVMSGGERLRDFVKRVNNPRLGTILGSLYARNSATYFVPLTLGGLDDGSFSAFPPGAKGLVEAMMTRAASLNVQIRTGAAVEGMAITKKRIDSLSVRIKGAGHGEEGTLTDVPVSGVMWCAPLPDLLSSLSACGVNAPRALVRCATPVDPESCICVYICLQSGVQRLERAFPGISTLVGGYVTDASPDLPTSLGEGVEVTSLGGASITCHRGPTVVPEAGAEDGGVVEVILGADPAPFMGIAGLAEGVGVGDVGTVTQEEYNAYKQAVGEAVTQWLMEHIEIKTTARHGEGSGEAEGLSPVSIAYTDVVTPYTYAHICRCTQGMCIGNMGQDNKQGSVKHGVRGVRNLAVGSTWTTSTGGLPVAAEQGAVGAQYLHKKWGKKKLREAE
ncbi:hypothetical protein KIPB_003444 [Kipferlia bialata]|uniref:Amine oxidase domain-containing protein n=1 Tax=Kipferlia bialata TaxID=797122 RepID=A0A9K3CU29_9EUKA|nr:hypothetical protein KIPB_003444 [Kipferlia bialata]|eukprot:g3444.t1